MSRGSGDENLGNAWMDASCRQGKGRGQSWVSKIGQGEGHCSSRQKRQSREFDWWYLGKAQVLSGPGRQRGEVHEWLYRGRAGS